MAHRIEKQMRFSKNTGGYVQVVIGILYKYYQRKAKAVVGGGGGRLEVTRSREFTETDSIAKAKQYKNEAGVDKMTAAAEVKSPIGWHWVCGGWILDGTSKS